MTMAVDIPPDILQRLTEEAARVGVEPPTSAALMVGRGLATDAEMSELPTRPTGEPRAGDSLRRLCSDWEADDAPEEDARLHEFTELEVGMNANSLSGRAVYP